MQAEKGNVAVADDALGVDDEDGAPHQPPGPQDAVGPDDLAVRVGQQRHGQPVLGAETLVRIDRLRGDPPYRDVEVIEAIGRIAIGAELARADRSEVSRVEGEQYPAPSRVGEVIAAI